MLIDDDKVIYYIDLDKMETIGGEKMAYSNNHYVPQFILRRFGTKINRYNVKTGEFKCKTSTINAFSDKDIYPEWLELLLGTIESKIADLIDKKVLTASSNVTITRKENWLIKKFFAIETLRVPGSSLYSVRHLDSVERLKQDGFKEIEISGESNLAYAYRTMKVLIESNSLEEVYNHKEVTYEACKWGTLFNNCYISIWDSSKCNEDFIITDNGMNCEHDRTRFLTFPNLCGKGPYTNNNYEMLKNGYVLKCLSDSKNLNNEKETLIYFNILNRMNYVHANYYYFAVSSTRTIALINPFYRLYYDADLLHIIKRKPNVWPTLLSQDAMSSNKQTYVSNGSISQEDKYHYTIKDLPLEDVITINCMALDRIKRWLGFDNSSKIARSLNVYSMTPKEFQRNNYENLKEVLFSLGCDFPNTRKYREMNEKMTRSFFTKEDVEYIEFFYNSIQYLKNLV